MSSVPFFLLFFAVAVSFAVLRGGAPERLTAIAYTLALAATLQVGFLRVPGDFQVVPLGLLLTDAALLAALCLLAIRANRWWLIPAAGCQLVAVLVHTGKLVYPAMFPISYEFLTDIWSWPMVALLVLGTWTNRRRRMSGVTIPDWKPSSARRGWTIRRAPQGN